MLQPRCPPYATGRLAGGASPFASAVLAGCGKKEEAESGPVVTVDVAPVLSSQIQRTIRAQALVYPLQQAAIAPKITAPIKKVYVEKGAKVRAGQLLVELENGDLAGAARESEAAYQAAEATYETTARATVPQDAQKAELDVRSAKDIPGCGSSRLREPPTACFVKERSRRRT